MAAIVRPRSISSLPSELLLLVFLHTIEMSSSTLTPVTISHVSSRWRSLALSHGRLWTSISATFPLHPHQISRMQEYLFRSGAYPVDVYVDIRDPEWNWEEDVHRINWKALDLVINTVLAHVDRWRKFEMLSDTWGPIYAILSASTQVASAPVLESVALSRCNVYYAAPGQTFQPFALKDGIRAFGDGSLPSLREVVLVGVHVDWASTSVFKGLTRLDLRYQSFDVMPTLSQFRTLLNDSPSLVNLSLSGWGPQFGDTSPISVRHTIHLPSLRRLHIGYLDASRAKDLLGLFVLPSLRELGLEDIFKVVNPVESEDASSILQALTQGDEIMGIPIGSLSSLEMSGVRASYNAYAQLYEKASSVVSVRFEDTDAASLEALSSSGPSQDLAGPLPHLEHMECQDIDDVALLQCLAYRSQASLGVPRVSLEYVRRAVVPRGSVVRAGLLNMGVEVVDRSESSNFDNSSAESLST